MRPVSNRSMAPWAVRAAACVAASILAGLALLRLGHHLWNHTPKEGER